MKSLLLAAVFVAVPLLALQDAPPAPIGDAAHPAIAVLPLRGQAAQGFGNPSDDIYQRVTTAFFKTKHFTMIERAQLGAVMGEGQKQGTVAFDDASAVALGKQVGAKVVVIGSYTGNMVRTEDRLVDKLGRVTELVFFPSDITVNLRMVDVETGRIKEIIDAKGTSKEGNPAKSLQTVMADLSKKLDREVSNHFPVTGYIIKVLDEKKAMIDLGKADGVADGDEFTVYERGEDIVHPVTGKIIKGEKKLITEFKVIGVAEDSATVKISGDKVALKPGMALESKPKKRGWLEAINDTIMK